MKYIILSLIIASSGFAVHAQDNQGNGKQSMETTKSRKEAVKEKKQVDKVHEQDKDAMDKQNEKFATKKRYKKDPKSKAK